ncbi:MAG TPA: prenyltransferase, partial [Levilinea sp.]|nr:prenyltransferase [Levilinea sp.]
LVIHGGVLALILLLAGIFFVLFYTYPLKYVGLGEIAVIIVWGPLMIGGGYYVLTGQWDWNVTIASLPYALGPTLVIFGKHIDKLMEDRARRIFTLPVILGEKAARMITLAMMAVQYLAVVYLIIAGFFSPLILVVFLSLRNLPRVWRMFTKPKPDQAPENYPPDTWPLWFVASAFYHNRSFGMVFLLGLALELGYRLIAGS